MLSVLLLLLLLFLLAAPSSFRGLIQIHNHTTHTLPRRKNPLSHDNIIS